MTLTPEMVEIERAAFEAYALREDLDTLRYHGMVEYHWLSTQRSWSAWLARAQSHCHIGYIDTAELSIIALDEPNMAGHITLASSPNQYEDTPVYICSPHAQSQRAVAVAELEALRTEVRAQAGLKDSYQDWDETERMLTALIDRAGGES